MFIPKTKTALQPYTGREVFCHLFSRGRLSLLTKFRKYTNTTPSELPITFPESPLTALRATANSAEKPPPSQIRLQGRNKDEIIASRGVACRLLFVTDSINMAAVPELRYWCSFVKPGGQSSLFRENHRPLSGSIGHHDDDDRESMMIFDIELKVEGFVRRARQEIEETDHHNPTTISEKSMTESHAQVESPFVQESTIENLKFDIGGVV